jgi:hypothetical protein
MIVKDNNVSNSDSQSNISENVGHVVLLLLLLLLSSSSFLVTGFPSSLVLLLLSQWWTPPLRLQVSDCSTFLMMCDVPSMAVFCKEYIECCPGIVSRYFCKLLLTIPVAPMISGMTKHFMFHILWIWIKNWIITIITCWCFCWWNCYCVGLGLFCLSK